MVRDDCSANFSKQVFQQTIDIEQYFA